MRTIIVAVLLLAAGAWLLSSPSSMSAADLPEHTPNAVAGERQFWAGGCASCHATPVDGERPQGAAKLLLGGGLELETPYGVFRAPNISTHSEDGIGDWTTLQFVNAMQYGISPDGRHYYPAFPFASYAKMPIADVIDLKAYMDTLPSVDGTVADHELDFPWSLRRGIGFWKRAYLSGEAVKAANTDDARIELGRSLVEGVGHCGECHTPRDALGGMQPELWLSGASNPDGDGRIPNITSASRSIGDWSIDDLAYYFESGFTPDFDTAGGSMVAVQENLAQLSSDDREAIAMYLKFVPAIEPSSNNSSSK